MSWGCIGCGTRSDDMDQAACANCGRKRDLSRRHNGAPVRPMVFSLPSRSGGPHHVLSVAKDRRVDCATCRAAQFGSKCWCGHDLEGRLRRHAQREVWQVLKTKERVWAVLDKDPSHVTWANDVALICKYFAFWHSLDWTAPGSGLEFLRLLLGNYRGNALERIRRVRAEIQNVDKEFLPSEEVREHRRTNEAAFRAIFSAGVTA